MTVPEKAGFFCLLRAALLCNQGAVLVVGSRKGLLQLARTIRGDRPGTHYFAQCVRFSLHRAKVRLQAVPLAGVRGGNFGALQELLQRGRLRVSATKPFLQRIQIRLPGGGFLRTPSRVVQVVPETEYRTEALGPPLGRSFALLGSTGLAVPAEECLVPLRLHPFQEPVYRDAARLQDCPPQDVGKVSD